MPYLFVDGGISLLLFRLCGGLDAGGLRFMGCMLRFEQVTQRLIENQCKNTGRNKQSKPEDGFLFGCV
jgi:hypothetical protein